MSVFLLDFHFRTNIILFLTLGTVEKPADRVFSRFAGFRDSKFLRLPLCCGKSKSVHIKIKRKFLHNSIVYVTILLLLRRI